MWTRRLTTFIALAALVLGGSPSSIAEAGGGGVHIVSIRYNAPGADDGSRDSLNAEVIMIRNDGDRRVSIKSWTVHDAGRDNFYKIPYDVRLAPDDYVRLYTGPGPDLTGDCVDGDCPRTHSWHWDKDHHVWGNSGDRATLSRADGSVVDRCSYTEEDRTPKRCS
jgi:hypothetical protein